jgi:hypothetical protein
MPAAAATSNETRGIRGLVGDYEGPDQVIQLFARQLNDNEVLVYHIRDGKVSEVWGYGTDPYAFDEFWS